ncbi:MAG: glycosyltransferase family 2 protein, partial [Pseudobutyrivibrio sp.]|nr:glycosyltransferase family 2 protein [Pseudobutyrivibrio sp.]
MISVILPVHNTKRYIEQCIDSILNQTYDDIEILAIDSSTDETTDIIKGYLNQTNKIRHILDPNGSYGYKLNLGIAEAKGDYLAIVDSDDYIMPDMLKTLLGEVEENQLDFVKSDFAEFKIDGDKEVVFNHMNNMWDPTYYDQIIDFKEHEELLNMISVSIWTGLYRTDFVRDNKIKLHESPAAS